MRFLLWYMTAMLSGSMIGWNTEMPNAVVTLICVCFVYALFFDIKEAFFDD